MKTTLTEAVYLLQKKFDGLHNMAIGIDYTNAKPIIYSEKPININLVVFKGYPVELQTIGKIKPC